MQAVLRCTVYKCKPRHLLARLLKLATSRVVSAEHNWVSTSVPLSPVLAPQLLVDDHRSLANPLHMSAQLLQIFVLSRQLHLYSRRTPFCEQFVLHCQGRATTSTAQSYGTKLCTSKYSEVLRISYFKGAQLHPVHNGKQSMQLSY